MLNPNYESLVPRDPVEVTVPFAQSLVFRPEFDEFEHSDYETQAVREMNISLMGFDMIGGYEVKTNLAFVVPEDTTPDEDGKVPLIRMDLETDFVGELMGGRTLKIGRELELGPSVGKQAIRAVCLSFQDVLIKSRQSVDSGKVFKYQRIEDDERLYVPVFAVSGISQYN